MLKIQSHKLSTILVTYQFNGLVLIGIFFISFESFLEFHHIFHEGHSFHEFISGACALLIQLVVVFWPETKNINLTDDPKFIEGKVNGTQIVLVAAYLKKQ